MSKQVKKWYMSRTIWLSVIALGTAVSGVLAEGGDWKLASLAGFAALSGVLRALTTEGIVL